MARVTVWVTGVVVELHEPDLAYPGALLHWRRYLDTVEKLPGILHIEPGSFTRWEARDDLFRFACVVAAAAHYDFALDPLDSVYPAIAVAIEFTPWTMQHDLLAMVDDAG